jgi:hypothetical protein
MPKEWAALERREVEFHDRVATIYEPVVDGNRVDMTRRGPRNRFRVAKAL